jgi:hypothetical protein
MQIDRGHRECIRRTVGTDGWRLRRAHMARGMIGLSAGGHSDCDAAQPRRGPATGGFLLEPQSVCRYPTTGHHPRGGQVIELHGRWLANATAGQQAAGGAGPTTYQLLGAGTAMASVTQPNSFEAGFQAVHNTTFFGGNWGGNLYAVIDNLSLNGSWTLQCPGPILFTAQGTGCPGHRL